MAHELTQRTNGLVEFAYLESDGLPWHGLGKAMRAGESIEAWREAAGMDWRIQRAKVRYPVSPNSDVMRVIDDKHVLMRSDNHEALGIVSDKYKVVQPGEVLEFFRDIVKVGGLELSAAGTLFGGKRFWATAKIGEAAPTSIKDTIGGYLLLSTSADGSLATEVRRTTVRTVCNNTLRMAMQNAPASMRIAHRSEFKPESVKSFMGLNEAAWEAFRHQVTRLANVNLPAEEAESLVIATLNGGKPTDAAVIEKTRESRGFTKIMSLFNGEGKGARLDGVWGTPWGFVNAVTEYADHWTTARTEQNRFASAQWGTAAGLKDMALELANGFVNA